MGRVWGGWGFRAWPGECVWSGSDPLTDWATEHWERPERHGAQVLGSDNRRFPPCWPPEHPAWCLA